MPVVDDHSSPLAGTRIAEIEPLIARIGMRNQLLKIVTENGLFGWGEGGRVLTAVLLAMAMCSNRVPRSPGLGVEASEDADQGTDRRARGERRISSGRMTQ